MESTRLTPEEQHHRYWQCFREANKTASAPVLHELIQMDEIGTLGEVEEEQSREAPRPTVKHWNWAQESKAQEWTDWWRRVVRRVFLLLMYHFFNIYAFAVAGIYLELLQTVFKKNTILALVSLLGRIFICLFGRSFHTGKNLTRVLICLDGFLSAFLYNCLVRDMQMPKDKDKETSGTGDDTYFVFVPISVSILMVIAYWIILVAGGVRLTAIKRNGVKVIPCEIFLVEQLLAQIPYFSYLDTHMHWLYHEYMSNIIIGGLLGLMICTGIACYILTKLRDDIDKKTVQDVLNVYSLVREDTVEHM